MRSNLITKLKGYSGLAAGLAVVSGANASIMYTDINPDFVGSGYGSFYDLDLDNDASTDFRIDVTGSSSSTFGTATSGPWGWVFRYANLNITGSNSNNRIAAMSTASAWQADTIPSGSIIDNYKNWVIPNNTGNIIWSSYYLSYYGTNVQGPYTSYVGNWFNTTNKYLGFKFDSGGNTYYGWARLDVTDPLNFTIKDYAYQACSNVPIAAGDTSHIPTDIATNVVATDTSNYADPSDMHIAFTKATDETKLVEYRIIVVPLAQAATFTEADAGKVVPGNYQVHIPNGSDFSATLFPGTKDKDGANIQQGVPYKVFVLSAPDGVNANMCGLSLPSDTITLDATVGAAMGVQAADQSDFANGTDMLVSFDKAADESSIVEYRILVVKTADAATFTLADAELVSSNGYFAVTPTGSNISGALSAVSNDVDGDLIIENVPYKVFIMSKGGANNMNSISTESNEVTLTSPSSMQELKNRSSITVVNAKELLVNLENSQQATFELVSLKGKVVHSQQLNTSTTRIPIDLSSGAYITRITAKDKYYVQKVFLR